MLAGSLNSFWAVFFTNDGRFAVHFSPCEIQPSGRPGFWALLMLSLVYEWLIGFNFKQMFDIFCADHQTIFLKPCMCSMTFRSTC